MDTPTLPNVARFLRLGVFSWLVYLLGLGILGYLLSLASGFVPWFAILQAAAALVLLGLTLTPIAARLKQIYLPLLIFWMSAVPIALNHLATHLGPPLPFFSAEGVVLRLLPLLAITLALIAWHYNWRQVLLFCIAITVWDIVLSGLDLAFPAAVNRQPSPIPPPPPVFGLPVPFAASSLASLVQFGVLLVAGAFISLLMQRLREQNAHLERLARTDPLTGVFNRRYFWELAEKEIARAQRYDEAVSVALFDLDHFKAINDTYGHLVGDQVIKFFASEGGKNFRSSDLFARYGGEEFVCLLTHVNAEEAQHKAEEIRQFIQSHPLQVEQQSIPVTVSVGVAELPKREPISLGELVNRADYALYKAKTGGRNRVMLFAAQ